MDRYSFPQMSDIDADEDDVSDDRWAEGSLLVGDRLDLRDALTLAQAIATP